ncbi:MAG TPA: hypothetical protein VGE22_08580 [Solimonas sp.]
MSFKYYDISLGARRRRPRRSWMLPYLVGVASGVFFVAMFV